MSACTGICCAAFTMDRSYVDILKGAHDGTVRDGEFVADMLIPLTHQEATERAARFGFECYVNPDPEKRPQLYTCKHWNENTRLCTVYEQRPNMCRRYPYPEMKECSHGCGFVMPEQSGNVTLLVVYGEGETKQVTET